MWRKAGHHFGYARDRDILLLLQESIALSVKNRNLIL